MNLPSPLSPPLLLVPLLSALLLALILPGSPLKTSLASSLDGSNPSASTQPSIPIVDISALRSSDAAAKLETVSKIKKACEEIGFMVITSHGVPEAVVSDAWKSVGEFFDLEESEKEKLSNMSADYPYGYEKGEVLAAGKDKEKGKALSTAPDIKETFTIGPNNPASGMPAPIMPSTPANFEAHYAAYYAAMEDLADTLLESFALGLDLPEDWFKSKVRDRRPD